MITDFFSLAIGNLKRRKLRSSLTIIGVFIAIATIFVLGSLSLGLNSTINEQFKQLGSDKFFITPKGQAGATGSGGAVQLTTKDVDEVAKVNGVNEVTYDTVGNAKITFNKENRYFMVGGIPLDTSNLLIESVGYKIDEGRFLKKGDIGRVMVGSKYKDNFFKKNVKVGDKIYVNEKEFKIVGILKSVGSPTDDKLVYMPIQDFKDLFNSSDRADQIIVQVKSGENMTKVADNTKTKLMRFRNVKEKTIDFDILTPEELLKSFNTILLVITIILGAIAGISIVVGGIGIINTMYTAVLERTKEIGTMKAIGAKNSDILWIFVIESGLLGVVGGIIGIIFGYIVGKLIEVVAQQSLGTSIFKIYTPWWLILGCILFAFLVGAFSGYFPARQASKLKPADTLRYE